MFKEISNIKDKGVHDEVNYAEACGNKDDWDEELDIDATDISKTDKFKDDVSKLENSLEVDKSQICEVLDGTEIDDVRTTKDECSTDITSRTIKDGRKSEKSMKYKEYELGSKSNEEYIG